MEIFPELPREFRFYPVFAGSLSGSFLPTHFNSHEAVHNSGFQLLGKRYTKLFIELAGVCGDVFHKNSEWAPEVDLPLAGGYESNTYCYPSLQVWFRNSRDTHDWDQRQVTVWVHKLGLGSQLRIVPRRLQCLPFHPARGFHRTPS